MKKNMLFILMMAFFIPSFVIAADFNDWNTLQRQVYVGGYLEYNTKKHLSNQLAPTYEIPIRLGKLKKNSVLISSISEEVLTESEKAQLQQQASYIDEYEEIQQSIQYGKITILNVDLSGISFDYDLFNPEGAEIESGSITLLLNEKGDLNGDGVYDIVFEDTISGVKGFKEHIRYLKFISSKYDLNTSMYSYNKSENATLNQESHFLGLNLKGQRLFLTENKSYPTRSFASKSIGSYDIDDGDIVLDINLGEYREVEDSTKTMNTRTLSSFASNRAVSRTIPVDEALPLFALKAGKTTYNSDNDATTLYKSKTAYNNEVAHFKKMAEKYPIKLGPFPLNIMLGDDIKVGVNDGNVSIGISINAHAAWTKATFKASKMIMISGKAGVETSQSLFSNNNSTTQTVLDRSAVGWTDGERKEIDIAPIHYVIGPVLIKVGAILRTGIDGNVELKSNESFGVDFCRIIKTEHEVSISLFDGIKKKNKEYKRLLLCPSVTTSLEFSASIIPYIELELYCKLWEVLYAGVIGRFSMGPYFNAKLVSSSTSDKESSYVSCELGIKKELNLKIKIGFEFKVKVEIFGVKLIDKSIEKKWTTLDKSLTNNMVILSYRFPIPPLHNIYRPAPVDLTNYSSATNMALKINPDLDVDQYINPAILNIINTILLD